MEQRQFNLSQSEIPSQWYNITADMKNVLPPLHPATGKPCRPEDLEAVFPKAIIEQEMSTERWVDIPDEIRNKLAMWRPAPLCRATFLEKALGTPAKIYYKYEGASPVGSHKVNTAVAQAYYNMCEGTKRIATETGAGQWGSAISMACAAYGIKCTVYMVKCSYEAKPYRRSLVHLYGAEIFPSPSINTQFGRDILAKDPNCNGSLGMAIGEAMEDTIAHDDVKYALGSVLNHVAMHQTVIGLEAKKQLALAGDYPDVVIGCVGGGSNFAGIASPFMADKFAGKNIRFTAVEPAVCPTITEGDYKYDFGDTAKLTPMLKMYSLGSQYMPPPDYAGGLRYHGMSPIISQLVNENMIDAVALKSKDVFEAATLFARTEGIVSAPESSHAICEAINEAKRAKEAGKEETILFCLSGHGFIDMGAYDAYFKSIGK